MNRADDPLLLACHEAIRSLGGNRAAVEAFVPGRIELFGKHTDYAGGSSIVAATDRGFRMVASPRNDTTIRMIPADDLSSMTWFTPGESPDLPAGHWLNYPATTSRRIALNFGEDVTLHGADISFLSDLPQADGMSSSSAFMVATFLVLAHLHRLEETPAYRENITTCEELAEYLGCVENGASFGTLAGETGVGTFGGSEDHTAMLCSEADAVSVFGYSPIRLIERIDWDDSLILVIATSGVTAEKTGEALGAYNRASLRAARTVEVFCSQTGEAFTTLRECAEHTQRIGLEPALAMLRSAEEGSEGLKDMRLSRRFEQFYHEEMEYIPGAVEAFRSGDWERLGAFSDASHQGAAEGLENQIPQTDALQQLAREHGALASSAFGAGFGGSVWALVQSVMEETFERAWSEAYRQIFPVEAAGSRTMSMHPAGRAWARPYDSLK
ncbi:galactokinase family protein [Gemmatimonadota bacterium]